MSRALSIFHGQFGRATLYDLDRPFATHAHREGHLIFFLGGSASNVQVSERSFPTTAHNAVAVSPWESHGFEPLSVGKSGTYLVLYISPGWFRTIGNAQRNLRFGVSNLQLTPEIRRSVDDLSAKLSSGQPVPNLEKMLFELTETCRVSSWWQNSEQRSGPSGSSAGNPIDFRVRKSIRLLSEHTSEVPDLDVVARQSGLSRPHFYKLFKQHTGLTPAMYFSTLRMERAVSLVASSQCSITDIAYRLGFSWQSAFTRFFISHVGMPPSDYRRVAQILHS